jgi:hypothetical protein
LVITTWYYARQVRRQADLLQEQTELLARQVRGSSRARDKDEKLAALDRVDAWSSDIMRALSEVRPDDAPAMSVRLAGLVRKTPTVGADAQHFEAAYQTAVQVAIHELSEYWTALTVNSPPSELAERAGKLGGRLYSVNASEAVQRLALQAAGAKE